MSVNKLMEYALKKAWMNISKTKQYLINEVF